MDSLSKSELLKDALLLVEEEDIELVFDLLDKEDIKAASLSKLKNEYIDGVHKTDADYTDRLRMALKEVLKDKLPSNSSNAAKRRFLIPAKNAVLDLGLIKSLLDGNPEAFEELFQENKWTKAAKYEYDIIVEKDCKDVSLAELESLCTKVFKEIRFAYQADELCGWHFLDRKRLRRALKKELAKFKNKTKFEPSIFLFPYIDEAMTDEIPNMLHSWYKDWGDGGKLNLCEPKFIGAVDIDSEEEYLDEDWEEAISKTLAAESSKASSGMPLIDVIAQLGEVTRIFYQKIKYPNEPERLDYFLNKWLNLKPWPSPVILILFVVNTKGVSIQNEKVWCCNTEKHLELINRLKLETFLEGQEGLHYEGDTEIFPDYDLELPLKEVLCHEKLVYTYR